MEKILVVDDEPKILKVVEHCLSREGYKVITAMDGNQAMEQFFQQEPDLIVLDLRLPHMDGFEVCRKIRETSSIPIIILSASNDEVDKILGFNLGVDDYLSKPFSPIELCLRLKAILRRIRRDERTPDSEHLNFSQNGLIVNPTTREVFVDGDLVELTAKEFDLLCLFVKHPNKVFTRKQLLYQIWQTDYCESDEVVTVLVSRLREKIKQQRDQTSSIRTVRGVGYKYVVN